MQFKKPVLDEIENRKEMDNSLKLPLTRINQDHINNLNMPITLSKRDVIKSLKDQKKKKNVQD